MGSKFFVSTILSVFMLNWLLCNIYFAAAKYHDMIDMKDNTLTLWLAETHSYGASNISVYVLT